MLLLDTPLRPEDDIEDVYAGRGLDRMSDARLVAEVGAVLRRPRLAPADSFVLHAPLELAARTALLPYVAPRHRERARIRLVALAAGYEASGPPVMEPEPAEFDSPRDAARRLAQMIDAGDVDGVDAVASWLGRSAAPGELADLLADTVVPRLGAAAHGSIFLYQLPRVAPRAEVTGELLRGLARELAREPEWRLTWHEAHRARVAEPLAPEALFRAVAATPRLGAPGGPFIHPVMSHVERAGVAAELLAGPASGVELDAGARVLLRAAASSMLHEPADHAPYGWSHCLTMPQAVLGIAGSCREPRAALAVAATYVVGFRAAFASQPLLAGDAPPDPRIDLARALSDEPGQAAAAVWNTPDAELGAVVGELATGASTRHDAHLVKYTLACLDAAVFDREYARLYFSAAASLLALWTAAGDPTDPLRR